MQIHCSFLSEHSPASVDSLFVFIGTHSIVCRFIVRFYRNTAHLMQIHCSFLSEHIPSYADSLFVFIGTQPILCRFIVRFYRNTAHLMQIHCLFLSEHSLSYADSLFVFIGASPSVQPLRCFIRYQRSIGWFIFVALYDSHEVSVH